MLLEVVPAGVEIEANWCELTHMEREKLEKEIMCTALPPVIKAPRALRMLGPVLKSKCQVILILKGKRDGPLF